jgi:hypothetical protein
VPGTRRKLRYRLIRVVIHPQVWTLILAVVVIGMWVHWRKVVGELKISPWVDVIFLAILFRPAIVELLRRTDKISTSWAQFSMKQLEDDVEEAETLEETNDPRVIELKDLWSAEDFVKLHQRIAESDAEHADTSESPEDLLSDPATIREQAAYLLTELDDLQRTVYEPDSQAGVFVLPKLLIVQRLQRLVRETEWLVLRPFGPEDGPDELTPDMAEHLAAWTGVSGWTNVIDVWRRTKRQVFGREVEETGRTELRLMATLVDHAMDILRKQLEAVAEFGRNE